MEELPEIIHIISDKQLRAEMIQDLINRSFHSAIDVSVLNTEKIESLEKGSGSNLFIIDLMGINEPSGKVIKNIKNHHPDRKLLALHIYRSSMLINPLYEMGIHGYLYYEPTKEELISAIKTVHQGKHHLPDFH